MERSGNAKSFIGTEQNAPIRSQISGDRGKNFLSLIGTNYLPTEKPLGNTNERKENHEDHYMS